MKHAITLLLLAAALLALVLLFTNRARPSCRPGSVEALFTDCRKL